MRMPNACEWPSSLCVLRSLGCIQQSADSIEMSREGTVPDSGRDKPVSSLLYDQVEPTCAIFTGPRLAINGNK